MRVLFLINSFSYSGAEKLVYDLSQALIPHCDYVGVAALYRMNDEIEIKMQEHLHQKKVRTYILDKAAGKDRISSICKTMRILREEQIDVLHAHCSVPMLIGKLAGKLTNVPVVCTVHNTRGYSVRRERLTGWMAKCYVSIGASAEEYMKCTLGIPERKITRIYNAVDTGAFHPEARTTHFWEQWGLRSDLPVVVNVGRVVEQKNQICLLRGLCRCRDAGKPIQAVILGSCDMNSGAYRELREYAESHQLQELVQFLGQQSEMQKFLSNADCFVMTSHYEGLSVSFLEAVFCGVPIIVTDMPFVQELNGIARCATVIPQEDDAALAQVLMEGGYSPPDAQAQKRFAQQFSMGGFVNAHFSLYRKIAKNVQ